MRALLLALLAATSVQAAEPAPAVTPSEIIAAAPKGDWRRIADEHTLYMELPAGRVVIELAPAFAPAAVANIKTLVRGAYFDGLAIMRAQDNYVVQWGDFDETRPLGKAAATVPAEFSRPAKGLAFDRLADGDVYAPEAGFAQGFPAARDLAAGQAWMAHCYGAVGVARGDAADSGNGAQLYAVIGHAPRHLDRNITLVGRVVQGMELLSVMPRGTDALGFYKTAAERTPIARVVVAADLPPERRTALEILRTDSASFAKLTEARRNRPDSWFKARAGRIDLCNAAPPIRPAGGP